MELRELQAYIRAKDHRPELRHAYFLKLIEEVGELAEVLRKERRMGETGEIKGTIEEEIVDVLYYTVAIANLYEVDLERCFHLKEAINKEKWARIAGTELPLPPEQSK